MFRSTILPSIVALWGAAIIINTLLNGTEGSGSYGAGQSAAALIGVIMVALGVRAVVKARTT